LEGNHRLLRRFPLDQLIDDDVQPGLVHIDPEAFIYDHGDSAEGHDGCSCTVLEVNDEGGDPRAGILRNWDTHAVAYVTVEDARTPEAGVVRDPMPDQSGHSLIKVRDPSRSERRRVWLPLRTKLASISQIIRDAEELEHL